MNSELKKIGQTFNTEYLTVDTDILVVVPKVGLKDTSESARINMEYQQNFVRGLAKKCGVAVVMTNLLSQDAEARRIYAEGMDPRLFFGAALVVSNPLSRAIGSFFLGLTKPGAPTRLFDSIENGIAWLKTIKGA